MKCYPAPIISERINDVYLKSGLTAEAFARKLGRERKSLYGWIHGVSAPNAETVRQICLEFHVSADWLLGLKEKKMKYTDEKLLGMIKELRSTAYTDGYNQAILVTCNHDSTMKMVREHAIREVVDRYRQWAYEDLEDVRHFEDVIKEEMLDEGRST